MVSCKLTVSGVVQGVGFRYFVYKTATRLMLFGSVKNKTNGNVEIVAEGERSLIEELIHNVKIGPPNAHVVNVSIEWNKWTGTFQSFEIR